MLYQQFIFLKTETIQTMISFSPQIPGKKAGKGGGSNKVLLLAKTASPQISSYQNKGIYFAKTRSAWL